MEAAGVDAAIVSDLGVMSVVQQHAPSVAIHVSTQASVSNAEAALMWYRLGARRVVCAREMSVAEIAAMRKAIPSDMEIRCLCTVPCAWLFRVVALSAITLPAVMPTKGNVFSRVVGNMS